MRQIFRTLLTSIFILLFFVLIVAVFHLGLEKKRITEEYHKERELWTIRNNTLRESLKKREEEVANLKKELERLNEELKNARDELSDLKLSYEGLKNENFSLSQRISNYTKERENLLKRITGLERDLKLAREAQKSKLSAEESWAELLKEKANLQLRINELEGRIKNNRLLLTQLEQEKNKLEHRLAEVQQDKFNIEKEIRKGTKLDSPREVLKANLEKENMERKLMDLTIERDNLENKINSLRMDIGRIEEEKQELNVQIERINQLLEEKLVQVNKVREELENALKEAKRLALSGISAVELPPVIVKKKEEIRDSKNISPSSLKFPPPQTEKANIILYNEKYNFVIINVGKKDGVIEGMIFDLYGDKENIGQIRIKEVREKLSAGEILEIKKNKKINPETTFAIFSP